MDGLTPSGVMDGGTVKRSYPVRKASRSGGLSSLLAEDMEVNPGYVVILLRLFRNQDDFEGGKYLVQRRDGTVPDWPYFVIGAADPAAPAALRAYAQMALDFGMDSEYCQDVMDLAEEFLDWRREHNTGDPDAPRHREDDPDVIARMKNGA